MDGDESETKASVEPTLTKTVGAYQERLMHVIQESSRRKSNLVESFRTVWHRWGCGGVVPRGAHIPEARFESDIPHECPTAQRTLKVRGTGN